MTFNRIKTIVFWLRYTPLLPWIRIKGKQVKQHSIRLPEADGPRQLSCNNDGITLIHIGESTVAGVGVQHMEQGLTFKTQSAMESLTNVSINTMHIYGVNGITLQQLLSTQTHWLQSTEDSKPLYLVTMGVNDTTNLTSLNQWSHNLLRLINCIRARNERAEILFTHVPDMNHFPALPWPLNRFLGNRSRLLDESLRGICKIHGCHYVHARVKAENEYMAEDGYHPNAHGYERWGQQIAERIQQIYQ